MDPYINIDQMTNDTIRVVMPDQILRQYIYRKYIYFIHVIQSHRCVQSGMSLTAKFSVHALAGAEPETDALTYHVLQS